MSTECKQYNCIVVFYNEIKRNTTIESVYQVIILLLGLSQTVTAPPLQNQSKFIITKFDIQSKCTLKNRNKCFKMYRKHGNQRLVLFRRYLSTAIDFSHVRDILIILISVDSECKLCIVHYNSLVS